MTIRVLVVDGSVSESDGLGVAPFLTLQYGATVQRTSGISQTSKPQWNATFDFEEIPRIDVINVTMYDALRVSPNDVVGTAELPVKKGKLVLYLTSPYGNPIDTYVRAEVLSGKSLSTREAVASSRAMSHRRARSRSATRLDQSFRPSSVPPLDMSSVHFAGSESRMSVDKRTDARGATRSPTRPGGNDRRERRGDRRGAERRRRLRRDSLLQSVSRDSAGSVATLTTESSRDARKARRMRVKEEAPSSSTSESSHDRAKKLETLMERLTTYEGQREAAAKAREERMEEIRARQAENGVNEKLVSLLVNQEAPGQKASQSRQIQRLLDLLAVQPAPPGGTDFDKLLDALERQREEERNATALMHRFLDAIEAQRRRAKPKTEEHILRMFALLEKQQADAEADRLKRLAEQQRRMDEETMELRRHMEELGGMPGAMGRYRMPTFELDSYSYYSSADGHERTAATVNARATAADRSADSRAARAAQKRAEAPRPRVVATHALAGGGGAGRASTTKGRTDHNREHHHRKHKGKRRRRRTQV